MMPAQTTERTCDVLVAGGGPAGAAAAAAAANHGADVIVCERLGYLGGSRTAAGVDTAYGFWSPGATPRRIVGGTGFRVIEELLARDAFTRPNSYGAGTGVTYDIETMKRVLDETVGPAVPLFHAPVVRAQADDDAIVAGVATASGIVDVRASVAVDATGDAQLLARLGGRFEDRRDAPIQSLTTIFFVAGVAPDVRPSHAELLAALERYGAAYNLPRLDGSLHRTPRPGVFQANMVRVSGVDPNDPFALSAAEVEGRRQANRYATFLRDRLAGFEDAYLLATAAHIGVREGRRTIGDYVLTEDDVVDGRRFDDAIACCAAPVEDHHAGADTRWVYVGGDGYYQIPYRSLLPAGVERLLVAGRCLSATHGAHASARNSAQAFAMGDAAGLAAAVAVAEDTVPRRLAAARVQDEVRAIGGLLEPVSEEVPA